MRGKIVHESSGGCAASLAAHGNGDEDEEGEIENADGVGEAGNPRCGDIMKIYLKVKDNVIEDVKFKTFGCASAIASSSSTVYSSPV